MANFLHAPRPATFCTHNLGGRNYDYTNIYSPDKPGEEAKENARVWNVYLDEAENHDVDMIEGFRNIIDGLLVFAALFSAVVTAFVAQTSQTLRPDNAQIMVSLLVETNQLLRAAGNRTSINAVPAASLGPKSRTYTSTDVWVNGLFFTSLSLSLSTALLSVLAKQWIQAYTATVSGDTKTRALMRQFRFEGLVKWKLGDIIESLPLILHCSVAVFLVGLALYVSQISRPICGVVAGITALTFLFYFASSMLPAFDMACPYRTPFMFPLAQLLFFAFRMARWNCFRLWYMLTDEPDFEIRLPPLRPSWVPQQPLRMAEHNTVLEQSPFDGRLAHNSLGWVYNHSSNRLVKEIVVEGTCGLLDEWSSLKEWCSDLPPSKSLNSSSGNSYLLSAIRYSLLRLPDTYAASSMEDEIGKSNKYGRLIVAFMRAYSFENLLDKCTASSRDWQEQIKTALLEAYKAALGDRRHVLSRWLLDLGGPNLFRSGSEWSARFLLPCANAGDAKDFRELVHRGVDLNCRDSDDWTVLHHAAFAGNLDAVVFLIEQEPALISAPADMVYTTSAWTALDAAAWNGKPDAVAYLFDHGAKSLFHSALYCAIGDVNRLHNVELLLDHGWDRTVKDTEGKTLLDIAHSEGDDALANHLERYQTVRLSPYGMTP